MPPVLEILQNVQNKRGEFKCTARSHTHVAARIRH